MLIVNKSGSTDDGRSELALLTNSTASAAAATNKPTASFIMGHENPIKKEEEEARGEFIQWSTNLVLIEKRKEMLSLLWCYEWML